MNEPHLCKLLRNKETKEGQIKDQLVKLFSYHHYFSFYAAIDDEKQYRDKKFYLFFGLPNGWEDREDKEKYKKNISKDELCFVRCLSYQQTESIAMWHMYGLPNNVRITIEGDDLINGLGLKEQHKDLYCYLIFKKNIIGEKFLIQSSQIEKFDLLYYSPNKDESTYFVQKDADVVVKKIKGESIAQLKDEFFLKRYAFASEVETRLQIRLEKKFLEEHLPKDKKISDICGLAIEPDFKDEEDFKQIKIVRRPEFLDVRNIKRKASLGNAIKYLDSKKYPATMYDEKIALERSELDEEEIDMKKIAEEKKKKVKTKAKNKLDELTKFVCDENRMKEINDFKTRFEICESIYKYLLEQYKQLNCKKEVKSIYLKLNISEVKAVLSFFEYKYDEIKITNLFGSEKAKGKRSAKSIRNALTHDFNESVAEELHNRKNEIYGYMDYFLSLIRDQNV